jgi:hypothetical protein
MYIRVKTTPNSPRKSVQLVASVRHGNKVSQRIVRHVGIAMDEEDVDKLTQLARHIKVKLEHDENPKLFPPEVIEKIEQSRQSRKQSSSSLPVNLQDIQEEQRFIQGIHAVYGALYEDLGFNKIFPNPARNRMATRIIRQIVLARIANPVSKRKSVTMLEKDFGVSLNLDYVYKVMDKISQDTTITRIKQTAYHATRSLFTEKIDVIFFDATTLYFESFKEDELK